MDFSQKIALINNIHKTSLKTSLFEELEILVQDMKKTDIEYVGYEFGEDRSGVYPGILFFSKIKKENMTDYGLETDGYASLIQGKLSNEVANEYEFSKKDVAFINKVTKFFNDNTIDIINNFVVNERDSIDIYKDKITLLFGDKADTKIDMGDGFAYPVPVEKKQKNKM